VKTSAQRHQRFEDQNEDAPYGVVFLLRLPSKTGLESLKPLLRLRGSERD